MPRLQKILNGLVFLASIPFLYFVFSNRPQNWLYHTALAVILLGSAVSLMIQWRTGNTRQVRSTLIQYAVVIIVCISLAMLFGS